MYPTIYFSGEEVESKKEASRKIRDASFFDLDSLVLLMQAKQT
jgi:hypothetical protein